MMSQSAETQELRNDLRQLKRQMASLVNTVRNSVPSDQRPSPKVLNSSGQLLLSAVD